MSMPLEHHQGYTVLTNRHAAATDNKRCLFSFKTLLSYGCLISIAFLFAINAYFEKISISQAVNGVFEMKTVILGRDMSRNYTNNKSCKPYNLHRSLFNVSIDGVVYPKYRQMYLDERINFECLNKDTASKVILFWNTWFGRADFDYGLGKNEPFIKNKCPVTNCELTNDRSRLNDSDLIVFHMRDPIYILPSFRYSNQRWVFYLHESPVHSWNYMQYNHLFNLSATYKVDSDFSSLYHSQFIWQENLDFDVDVDFSQGKSETATIVVSNCDAGNNRLGFIKELQKTMSVTIFGKCGQPCPKTFENGTAGDCKEIIAKKYKFYLAFENSICQDYITEKFFDILRFNIIPVVYGGGDYERFVPKSGFINVFDFASPQKLAEYLLYLNSNKTAFNSYFKWKRFIKFRDDLPRYGHEICEMCIRLNLDVHETLKYKSIDDMSSFWNSGTQCKS